MISLPQREVLQLEDRECIPTHRIARGGGIMSELRIIPSFLERRVSEHQMRWVSLRHCAPRNFPLQRKSAAL
jgi:hypothetical protein